MSKEFEEFQQALREQREAIEEFMRHNFTWLGADLMRLGAESERIGEQVRQQGEDIKRHGFELKRLGEAVKSSVSESNERYNQVFGRLRLTEKRLEAMLGATDSDRKDLREVCHDLDRRLTEVEKRLSA